MNLRFPPTTVVGKQPGVGPSILRLFHSLYQIKNNYYTVKTKKKKEKKRPN